MSARFLGRGGHHAALLLAVSACTPAPSFDPAVPEAPAPAPAPVPHAPDQPARAEPRRPLPGPDQVDAVIVGESPLGDGKCVQKSYEVDPDGEGDDRLWIHFERCGGSKGESFEALEVGKTYRFTIDRGGSGNFGDAPMIVDADAL